MLDLEQILKELDSFVRKLTDDKEKNIQDIQTQRKEICEEIHKIRKSLNDRQRIEFFIVIFTMIVQGLDNSW
jgi:hypothetical protein